MRAMNPSASTLFHLNKLPSYHLPMSPPTERFRTLSLGSMPPVTRLQSRKQRVEVEDSSSESDTERDFDIDDDGFMVSPSNLRYSLHLLDEETRDNVNKAIEVPPQFTLRGCQAGDERCLFLITEPAEYTVRTGSEQSGYGIPSCTCQNGERGESPCRHILWLLDQITNQVLGVQRSPFSLTKYGYPAELGNPYDEISEFHLDMLADSLHCDVVGQSPDPNPRRVRETREILASLNEVPTDEYRPDLFNNPRKGRRVIKRGDLEQTIFRMLLRNDDFFQYFLSSMRADEMHSNQFRSLQLRADAALAGLRQYADTITTTAAAAATIPTPEQNGARPKDVKWCAAHLTRVTRQIHSIIHNTERPLSRWELRAAARAAVHILSSVVDWDDDRDVGPPTVVPRAERNLFFRLIGGEDGNGNGNFVVDILASIPPEVLGPWVDELTDLQRRIAERGAPVAYNARLGSLVSHLRARWTAGREGVEGGSGSGSGSGGSKRMGMGQGLGGSAKRVR
ncbi:hypothetical protein F5Y00DRAFT_269831 [Daldinia vernicosa]|uniref:uncharacterized protein n=1 Tax=Daldinia vernicosa TaxID=114800 RepID=UPI002007555D|nr:uncharacterized protein F5Y00DRAFT_269831 [Daldinia vernicosa]KAI0848889.1 hypothetical protein F5Y00DRAFT_269831 [Daldinia vernicosa]